MDFAVSKGYSVVNYDRLGFGKSWDGISGYQVQGPVQVALLEQLVMAIRSGKISTPPSKVVLVGHSLGSIISNAVLNSNPNLVDGAILTGIAYYGVSGQVATEVKQLRLASVANPAKWGDRDSGFLTWVDIYSNIEGYVYTCSAKA